MLEDGDASCWRAGHPGLCQGAPGFPLKRSFKEDIRTYKGYIELVLVSIGGSWDFVTA